ncbi:phytanoyl-CoA dioxygenase family protein [Caballeronia sp. LZ001]|uniref:phytanoyl-CoA dioxygenase family protein n=1 Tax=Caballeronia sp. LZ001 TaxID=3038553 RepID=UPI0028660EA5|nr:phytanoyl-CoA dioxygenase family protein [Caballeronia sp. LZ001]MDR5800625.1 phytanoyl-CoA dioxygenase family protein [Caballeronia sp. LZ001]
MRFLQEKVFEFDVNGFTIIRSAIDRPVLKKLNSFWDEHLLDRYLHDVDLMWSQEWRGLIDCDAVFPLFDKLFSSNFRLDHMFCVDERFVSSGGKMHHRSDMFEECVFYHVSNGKIFNGLTGVMYALSDMDSLTSHFCCIPASHKANFDVPAEYREPRSSPLLRHVYLEKGDALVFSEALVHGTYVVENSKQRRAVFSRYTNSYSYYRKPPEHEELSFLPSTPNYSDNLPKRFEKCLLTARQQRLVKLPAFARGRERIQ